MAKRVLLSNASSGMAGGMGAVDAALADLATDASGNGAQFLAGDGTFKAAGGGAVQSVTVTLTSAQLKALNTTPVTIVAAPGAGKQILVFAVFYELIFGTAAYTNIDAPGLYYNNALSAPIEAGATAANIFGASGNKTGRGTPGSASNTIGPNAPVVFADDQAWATGDGTGSVTAFYATVTL